MPTRPPYPIRTLKLAQPRVHGTDVAAVQRRLRGVYADGEYGPATGVAVKDWKWRVGYPAAQVNTALGPGEHLVLVGFRKRTAAMIARTAARAAAKQLERFTPKPPLGERILAEARKRIGLTESPAGSNRVPAIQRWAESMGAGYAGMGFAWCAYFAFLCALAAGSESAKSGLVRRTWNALYTPTIVAKARAGEEGLSIVATADVRPGDFALIDFPGGDPVVDHIEIVEVPPAQVGNGEYVSIGGNTSAGDSGSQSNGGGVFRRRRYTSQVRAFIRAS